MIPTSRPIPQFFTSDAYLSNSIGFEPFFDRIQTISKLLALGNDGNSFPPFNIRRVDNTTRIVDLAVAGYKDYELEVTVQSNNVLAVSGCKIEKGEPENDFVYQGIAGRKFTRKFALADDTKITNAVLKDGVLSITIVIEMPKPEPVQIIKIDKE